MMTVINPDRTTHRAPLSAIGDWRIEGGISPCVFGGLVERLAEYEALGYEPCELARLVPARRRLMPHEAEAKK